MRIALRIGVGVLVLAVMALGALALALPRIVASDAVKSRLNDAAAEATGADVGFESISFGLVPPRLVVTGPRVSEPGRADPLVAAESLDLEVQLLPLLARTVVVDSLVVEGARVRLVRTAEGLELPRPAPAEPGAGPASSSPPDGKGADEPQATGVQLAIGQLELRGASLVLEDRAVTPPVTWELLDVDARARGTSLEDPVAVQLSGRLASGGTLSLEGDVRLDGRIDLEAELDGVMLAHAQPYATGVQGLAGRVSGKLGAAGTLDSPTALQADLVLDEAELRVDEMGFQGRLELDARLEPGTGGLAGPFSMDATRAAVHYGEFFVKPPGKQATATGKLGLDSTGQVEITNLHLKVQDFEAQGRLETGARTEIELTVPPFELGGVLPLFPTLGDYGLAGRMGVERLVAVPEPLSLDGTIQLDGLRVRPGDGEAITLSGVLRAQGTSLASQGLEARVGGELVKLEARLDDLAGSPRYRLRADTDAAELRALLRAFGAPDDVISGPLTAATDLSGSLAAPEPLGDVRGTARLDVGRGTLRGVSLLEGTVDRLGALGAFAFALGSVKGGSSLQRFYGDEFESITGSFRIGEGRARSDDLKLVYRHYEVDLQGSLGLVDTSLDFGGRLTIHPEVDEALQGEASGPGREKVIPLAHVGGTLAEPRIELTREAVVALAASPKRGELEKEIDERLGEGSGREVLDALEGLLGGRKRP